MNRPEQVPTCLRGGALLRDLGVWWLVYSAKGPAKSRWVVVGGTGKYKKLRGTGTTTFLQQLQGVQATQQTWEQIYDGQMTGLPK